MEGATDENVNPKEGSQEARQEEVAEALPPDEFEGVEGTSRSDKAEAFWEDNWHKRLGPVQGRRRFILQSHWRGLSKEEKDFSEEKLYKTNHSVHHDLRFAISEELAWWGMTLFSGTAESNTPEPKVFRLGPGLTLQTWPKYVVPDKGINQWLSLALKGPVTIEPGGPGATKDSYARFFAIDHGEYELGVANRSFIEIFFYGEHLKGRYTFLKAEQDGRRWWLLSKPEEQEPYSKTHTLEETLGRLKARGHKYLIWDSKTYDVRTGKPM